MRRAGNRQRGTPADQWNQFYEADLPGGGSFTDGILKLNQVFRQGNVLEALALGYIDEDDQDVYASMFMRGIRQLQHPAMAEKFKAVLEPAKDAEIDATKLPFYLQVTLSQIAASNSVNGRAHQRRVDMHTQYNSAAAIGALLRSSRISADVLNGDPPAQRQGQGEPVA